jgi:hypothetical protein
LASCSDEYLPGSSAELVFNLDEVAVSEWEDRTQRKVIIPASMTDQTIHHGVHRNLNYISVTCYVSAAAGSLTLFVVSSQINDKVIETLKINGFQMGMDMVLEQRQKAYVTATLFQQYVTSVLIPFIERLRKSGIHRQISDLLMDNYSYDARGFRNFEGL